MTIQENTELAQSLAAKINPRSFSFRLPGLFAWAVLAFAVVGWFFFPRVVLETARVVAFYSLIRFIIIALFYVVGLFKLTRTIRRVKQGVFNGKTADQVAAYRSVRHVVLVANYNEPIEIIERTLRSLAAQPNASQQLIVALAMEEREAGCRAKAAQLIEQFEGSFAHLIATYHPDDLPNEIVGKGPNLTWAARQVKAQLIDPLGLPVENMTVSSSDVDSILYPGYFDELSMRFVGDTRRHQTIWQPPQLLDNGIWNTAASIRLMTYFISATHVAELANPWGMPLPLSTYSMSFKLACEVGYWDGQVIADDVHMFLRCFFGLGGKMTLEPIFLPCTGNPIHGDTLWQAWVNFYRQHMRHGWGAEDIGYVLQQWRKPTGAPFITTLARFAKIIHDPMIFSAGGLLVMIGTLLSLVVDGNPVITFPIISPEWTTVFQILNALSVYSLIAIWLLERTRSSAGRSSWRAWMLVKEAVLMLVFPVMLILLVGMPVLHAHTKMALAQQITFHRTPKKA